MTKPFLLLTSRDDEVVAADEREALPRLAGMSPGEAHWVRMEREPFPEVDLAEWSGIVVCGSPFDASRAPEAKSDLQRGIEERLADLYDRVLSRDTPFLGICYGLGTFTLHLGGHVDDRYGEEISAPELHVTPEGRLDPLLEGVPDTFHGYVGHHEAAADVAPGADLLVTARDTPVQMIRVGERAYATQFHPELDVAGIDVRIREYADRGYFPPDEVDRVRTGVRSVDVSPAHLVLANFVRLFRS